MYALLHSTTTVRQEAKIKQLNHVEQRMPRALVLKDQRGWDIIPFSEILRCEAQGNYSKIVKVCGSIYISCMTLKSLNIKLNQEGFIRVHQSHLIAIDHIRRVDQSGYVVMSNQTEIPVSRRRRGDLLKQLALG